MSKKETSKKNRIASVLLKIRLVYIISIYEDVFGIYKYGQFDIINVSNIDIQNWTADSSGGGKDTRGVRGR